VLEEFGSQSDVFRTFFSFSPLFLNPYFPRSRSRSSFLIFFFLTVKIDSSKFRSYRVYILGVFTTPIQQKFTKIIKIKLK
jgi:hypothetical protein